PHVECAGVNLQAILQVILVHTFSPAISKLLFLAAAGKIQPWLVEESAELVDASHPDENGRGIRHVLKSRLAFAQLCLSSYALLDHCRQKQQRNRQNDQKYLNRKRILFRRFAGEWPMAVACTPNRQETDNRDGSACSQRAESYRCPNQEWQREKKKSQIDARSKLIKDSVAEQQKTNKENTCFQITRKPAGSQGRNSGRCPRYDQRHDY